MRRAALLLSLLSLAACSQGTDPSAMESSDASDPATSAAPSTPATVAATARKVDESTDLYAFDYAYPAAAAALPALREWLEADLTAKRGELVTMARDARRDARGSGIEFRPYGDGTDWKVVTDLPGWLSLSAELYSDTGGAHPNHGYDALVFNRATTKQMDPRDLFLTRAVLSKAIRARFCVLLDAERAKRRGAPVDRHSGDQFDACIDPVESTIILGSSNGATFDRIGVLVGPYEAGSYAEGDYEFTLPVTPQVLAAVKPQYRAAFAVKR